MKHLTARDVMGRRVIWVSESMTVAELAGILVEKSISGAPVVDSDGAPVGVVSLKDIVESGLRDCSGSGREVNKGHFYQEGWDTTPSDRDLEKLAENKIKSLLVKDIMTPTIISVPENAPLSEVAATMLNARIHRLAVTRDDELIGLITTMDMLKIIRDAL